MTATNATTDDSTTRTTTGTSLDYDHAPAVAAYLDALVLVRQLSRDATGTVRHNTRRVRDLAQQATHDVLAAVEDDGTLIREVYATIGYFGSHRSSQTIEGGLERLVAELDRVETDPVPAGHTNWDSDDWDAFNGTGDGEYWYVSTYGNIERECGRCGYVGTHSHPLRKEPTIRAPLYHHCPVYTCGLQFPDRR